MTFPSRFSDQNDSKNESTRKAEFSEVHLISNPQLLDCLNRLHCLDRDLAALRRKITNTPDLQASRLELERIKSLELDKLQKLDEIRLKKNPLGISLESCREKIMKLEHAQTTVGKSEKSKKNYKEIVDLRILEQNLELKVKQLTGESEAIQNQVASLQDRQKRMTEGLQSSLEQAESKSREFESSIREFEVQRTQILEKLPAKYLSLYQRILNLCGGIAIAKMIGMSCDGCHIIFTSQFVIEFLRVENVEQCPSCRRLLIGSAQEQKNA